MKKRMFPAGIAAVLASVLLIGNVAVFAEELPYASEDVSIVTEEAGLLPEEAQDEVIDAALTEEAQEAIAETEPEAATPKEELELTEVPFAAEGLELAEEPEGEDGQAAEEPEAPAITMAAPAFTKINCTNGAINVQWSAVDDADGYRLYKKEADGSYKKVLTTSNTGYKDSKVSVGKTYSYIVKAYQIIDGKYVWSQYPEAPATCYVLSAPVMRSIARSGSALGITWKAVANAKNYSVFRKASGAKSWIRVGVVTTTSFKDTSVKKGTVYSYKVRANSSQGQSRYSAKILSGIILADPTMKSAAASDEGIKISWSAVKGAKAYGIYRKTGSGSWKHIYTVNGATSYFDKTCVSGKTSYYKVKAIHTTASRTFRSNASAKAVSAKFSNPAIALAKERLAACGNDLHAAYKWCASLSYAYEQEVNENVVEHAVYSFKTKRGDCLGKACTFYYMAKLLGYDVRVEFGHTRTSTGLAEHGWVEIYYNGKWKVCDPSFEFGTGRNGWMIEYGQKGTFRYADHKTIS